MSRLVVTNGGQAHRDDLLAVALAISCGGLPPVARRDPSPEELEDPDVLVLDVGGRHEPAKGNFDHHQFGRDAEATCAFALYIAARTALDFSAHRWFLPTLVLDSKGPFALAKLLGCGPAAVFALRSPVEDALLSLFGSRTRIDSGEPLYRVLLDMGLVLRDEAARLADLIGALEAGLRVWMLDGVEILFVDLPLAGAAGRAMCDLRDGRYPSAGIQISRDDRGSGWACLRYGDHPRVDLSCLAGDPAVLFAHPGGFKACTRERIPHGQLLDLLRGAIVP